MRSWVFTTKPDHFKMAEALVPGETLDWPSFGKFKFAQGDRVFFYASTPVLQMIGKCEIEEVDVPFSNVNPRNDLRKWPKRHSRIPWLRLRVLQAAPIPFKPLQRGSLYYHTEFKPSPYPKLLHESEAPYVLAAFDQAMTYSADTLRHEGGIEEAALQRVEQRRLLRQSVEGILGGVISDLHFNASENSLSATLTRRTESLTLTFTGLRRIHWEQEHADEAITGVRLSLSDIYLLTTIDGPSLEILSSALRVD